MKGRWCSQPFLCIQAWQPCRMGAHCYQRRTEHPFHSDVCLAAVTGVVLSEAGVEKSRSVCFQRVGSFPHVLLLPQGLRWGKTDSSYSKDATQRRCRTGGVWAGGSESGVLAGQRNNVNKIQEARKVQGPRVQESMPP